MNKNILFVGVGGQGTILASKVLVEGLIKAGYDVKMSEVHGMAQRGGSVSTQVRFGDKVYSPLIEKGTCDAIVAFEKSEAARWMDYLKKDGIMIVNDLELMPVTVNIGLEKYPTNVSEKLKLEVPKMKEIKALEIAEKLGNSKAQNMVILGALIKSLDLLDVDFESVIKENLKEKLHELNINAFNEGVKCVEDDVVLV